jgi:predicted phage terminase large subunit-like protein
MRRILELMRIEARPFADTSADAVAKRKALPFDDWARGYFPHYFFCESAPMHLLADDLVEEKGIVIAEFWSRGAGKTVRACLRRIRRILEGKSHFIVVCCQTEDNAAEKMDAIKLELENNPRLRQDYGDDISPKLGSNEGEDWIAVQTRVLARGINQSFRGLLYGAHRPDDVLCDDLEDDILARNPAREKQLWEHLFSNAFPACKDLGAGAYFEVLLNNFGRHCLKQKMREAAKTFDAAGKPICRYIEFLIEDERGESTWPARFVTPALRRMQAMMGTKLYRREMLGKEDDDDADFREAWFKPFRVADLDLKECEIRAYLDPSAKATERNDYKAFVVLARPIGTNRKYCIHARLRKSMSALEMCKAAVEIDDRYSPGKFACEDNGFQEYIWPLLELNQELAGRIAKVALSPVTNTQAKADRILRNAPDFEQGNCYFDVEDSDQRILVDQFLDYGKTGVHDDGPDALHMLWMAATTGLPRVSSARRSRLICSTSAKISPAFSGPAVIIALRSPPAKKVFLPLVITTPVIESFSARSRCTAWCIDSL